MGNNAAASQTIDAWIKRLQGLPSLVKDAAPVVADRVRSILQEGANAGVAPDGTPWPLTKKDSRKALPGAASAINVRAVGSVILMSVEGYWYYHQIGIRVPRRALIPDGQLGRKLTDAMRQEISKAFNRKMGGG